MKIAFCYPGQGVQQVGMAEGFVKSGEHYADMISEATKASGVDMNKLLFEPNEDITLFRRILQPLCCRRHEL